MLCEFANRFPKDLAILLERDRHLTRNFREETATDPLMMGLTPLRPRGVHVDFADETVTGADMDWIYAAPHEVGGGSYLRLMIQAKRAKLQTLKSGSTYWFYDQLDHGTPKGSQAQALVTHAAGKPDGMDTLPLYMFYHPQSALEAVSAGPAGDRRHQHPTGARHRRHSYRRVQKEAEKGQPLAQRLHDAVRPTLLAHSHPARTATTVG